MVYPIPLLSPEQLERLKELADASRLRAARSQPPKPPQRHRTRQYPSGKPNPPMAAHAALQVPPGMNRCAAG